MISVAETAPTHRVYVIEPQKVMAEALCGMLASDPSIDVVGETYEVDADSIARAQPDVILLDAAGDPAAAMASIRMLKTDSRIHAKICILSMWLQADTAMQALSAGAAGYIVKDVSPAEFFTSFTALMRDGLFVDARLSGVLLRRHVERKWTDIRLSPREGEIVRLIARGFSNKEISRALTLSDKTVKNHISNIFSKLSCTARTQVAIYAIREGLT
jgi:DNA-binding NarL/FixJ family response regulator